MRGVRNRIWRLFSRRLNSNLAGMCLQAAKLRLNLVEGTRSTHHSTLLKNLWPASRTNNHPSTNTDLARQQHFHKEPLRRR